MNLPKNIAKELKKYRSRQGRKKADYYFIEGERCCEEAQKWCSSVDFAVVVESCENRQFDFPVYTVSDKEFDELSLTENSQGIFMVAKRPDYNPPAFKDPFILVLDRLQEPGNLGTILRTSLSVGIREIVLTRGTVDPFNPKAIRAGMGAQFRQNFTMYDDLQEASIDFENNGLRVWLTTPHEGISCYDDSFDLNRSALVLGEEGGGIEDFARGRKTMIPMPGGVESLNVAQAATIYLFEGVRRGIL